jgi:sugar phosphate permease
MASPFSGWILDHWNWRVMLIAEGSLPFVWLAIWLLFIQDHPAQASWLPKEERTRLVETLHRESAELEGSQKIPYLRALLRPEVFLLAAIYFCFVSGQMGLLFWLPSAMDKFRKLSSLSTGMLYTLPFIVGAISVLAVSRHSDKMRERRFHAAGAMLFGGTCILLAVATIPYSLLIAFGFIALSGVGAYGPMGAFWAIPTETLSPQIVGSVMGFVNAIGNLGAYFAPLIVGYLNKRTGSFLAGFTYLGVITLVAGGLTMLIKTAPVHAKAGT